MVFLCVSNIFIDRNGENVSPFSHGDISHYIINNKYANVKWNQDYPNDQGNNLHPELLIDEMTQEVDSHARGSFYILHFFFGTFILSLDTYVL